MREGEERRGREPSRVKESGTLLSVETVQVIYGPFLS